MSYRSLLVLPILLAVAVPAPAGAASIAGKWQGTITLVKGGSNSFPIVMKIFDDLKQGKRGGRIINPGTPCKGKIIYLGRKGPKYLFRYRETASPGECTGDDKVTVNLAGGRLNWKGVSPGGVVGKGRLTRA